MNGTSTTADPSRIRGTGRGARARLAVFALLVAAVAALVLGPAQVSHATAPVDLKGSYVVDEANVLSKSDKASITKSLNKLNADTGINLLVVYVPNFSNPSDRAQWGAKTADLNSLGTNDILLSVAVQDRLYDVSKDSGSKLTTSQLASIETDDLVPQLRDSKWAAAATAMATGIDKAAGPADLSWIPVVLIIVVVVIIAIIVFVVVRRRRNRSRELAKAQASQAELDRKAGGLLVGIDDQITQASQEVGFAMAQFGEAAAKPFADAVRSAKGKAQQAFELRQKLDDAIPDTPEQKRAWTEQIIELCEGAHADIEAQSEAYDRLRASEATVEDDAKRLRTAAADLKRRADTADGTLAALTSTYSAKAVTSIAQNPDQADRLLEFVGEKADEAEAQIRADKKGEAVGAVQQGQQALVQVGQLLDAIDKGQEALGSAQSTIDAATADLRCDLQAAQKVPAGSAPQGTDLPGAVTEVQAALGFADSHRDDPLTALARLTAANTSIDTAMAQIRDAEVSRQRAQATLDQALQNARAQISAARDFIETRRGAISAGPRTRLSEAERHLSTAVSLATSDPQTAVGEAQQAAAMASQAANDANDEVGTYQGGGGFGGGGGMFGGGGRGQGGANLGGILTGVIIGGLLNGGGGGGGFGGGGMFGGGGGGFGGGDGGGFGGGDGGGGRDDSGGRF